jgi:hypothetical protein
MKALAIAAALALAAVPTEAASNKQTSKRDRAQAPQPRIACTVVGCLPVPPGCYPASGLRSDGTPTGYDVMVCGGGAYTIYGYR